MPSDSDFKSYILIIVGRRRGGSMEPHKPPESATDQRYLALICPIKLTNHAIEQLDALYYQSACWITTTELGAK